MRHRDEADHIRVWNVHEGVTATVGAQERFNVLGKVLDPEDTVELHARLNGGDWVPVPVNLTTGSKARLRAPGDFNIDRIHIDALRPTNVLELRQTLRDGAQRRRRIRFQAAERPGGSPDFTLAVQPGKIEEFCQVVDGDWRVVACEDSSSIGISRSQAGYDRIVLFGDRDWTTGYEVEACLTVDAWTYHVHNVGLLFKWNPHAEGNDAVLPIRWSTGLAYYASASPGLRLRYGVDVTYARGVRHGDFVLGEAPLAWWTRTPAWLLRAAWFMSGRRLVLSQLRTGVRYRFRARIDPTCYQLTAWCDGKRAPRPQVVVSSPTEHLRAGAVGIIAQNAAVRVHEFTVRPVT